MDETPIKAVELVRSIRDRMYEETKDLSPDELIAYVTREAANAVATVPPATDRSADRTVA